MDNAKKFIADNGDRFIEELKEILRIPSISPEKEHAPDMVRCAEKIKECLLEAGADTAAVYTTAGNPVVFGSKTVDRSLPTVLVYAHYDVMPVDPVELWDTDPFEPVIRDGRLWGRGSDDDKGQSFMHVKAMETMLATGGLPCNIKFMIEGEEEIGSPALEKWCGDNKEMLAADIIVVSDTSMLAWEVPSITVGLRGLCYMEVSVKGPNRDLHSGLYGGAIANPINVLAKMIASLTDDKGRVTIPCFYDDVRELSAAERREFNKAPFSEEDYKISLAVDATSGEEGYSTLERTGTRPSLDSNGIWGGYTEAGAKTVIPSEAHAKISMRLVSDQDWHKIAELFEKHFRAIAPAGVTVEVKKLHGGFPYVSPTDLTAYRAAAAAIESTFGKKPLPYYSGGSIPIISTFEKVLGLKSILMGFGLDRDATHSPNESFGLENFFRGIETIVVFHHKYAEMMKK